LKTKTYLSILALTLAEITVAAETPSDSSTVSQMPTVTVFDHSLLAEEQPADDTGRPEWTGARRFGNTRIYIQQAPWEVGVETWWRLENNPNHTLSHRLLEEVEIGLPGRMQLDLYQDIEGNGKARFHWQSFNVELRYALADWGKIWGNPTLYSEYKFADHHWGPDVYEEKLLLGDQIATRWHWGANFVWEAETGGDREQEFQITGGLSYSVIDGKLGIGVETLYDHDSLKNMRGSAAAEIFAVGPSIQWRVTKHMHVDLNCMFGTNKDSQRQIGFLIFGYDFGRGESGNHAYTPISGQRN